MNNENELLLSYKNSVKAIIEHVGSDDGFYIELMENSILDSEGMDFHDYTEAVWSVNINKGTIAYNTCTKELFSATGCREYVKPILNGTIHRGKELVMLTVQEEDDNVYMTMLLDPNNEVPWNAYVAGKSAMKAK